MFFQAYHLTSFHINGISGDHTENQQQLIYFDIFKMKIQLYKIKCINFLLSSPFPTSIQTFFAHEGTDYPLYI